MTFLHPWVLLPLGRTGATPLVDSRSLRAGIILPFDHQPHSQARWLRWALGVFEVAPLLLLAAALVMMAGPQMMKKPKAERLLTNIQVIWH